VNVKLIPPLSGYFLKANPGRKGNYGWSIGGIFTLTIRFVSADVRHKSIYIMPAPSDHQAKRQTLHATGSFNPRAAEVRHASFQQSEFFDPEDLLQLKYETLRALEEKDYSITQAAADFGLSRPTIYQAKQQFLEQGLVGLLPRKRGPKHPHKLTAEIRQHLRELIAAEPTLKAPELAARLQQRFRIKVHPRTIEKALKARLKRGRQISP
jgi:transposase